jgi:L-threonylcarbamoyladenylate synthase
MQHKTPESEYFAMPADSAPEVVPATAAAIQRAARLIRDGGLVAFPTETVYGLGADATQGRAVAGIFALKGRPAFNPLIVHVGGIAEADRYGVIDSRAEELATLFWPGPLTLVLRQRARAGIADLVTAGLDTIAIRVPAHPVARALIAAAGVPVAAPSANRSGRISATAAIHVAEEFGHVREEFGVGLGMILAGGRTEFGLESTILDLSGERPLVLRPGAVTEADIAGVIGRCETATGDPDRPSAPGQLRRHYAPTTPLRLRADAVRPGEALLAFGPPPLGASAVARVLNLSEAGDLAEAAANLFAMLRMLDSGGHAGIAVMPIPAVGLGIAINDRLARGAAPPDRES